MTIIESEYVSLQREGHEVAERIGSTIDHVRDMERGDPLYDLVTAQMVHMTGYLECVYERIRLIEQTMITARRGPTG